MIIVNFLSLLCLTYLIAYGATPIELVKIYFNISNESYPTSNVIIFIRELVNCALCVGFWVGLLYYQSILLACLVSICAEILTNYLKNNQKL